MSASSIGPRCHVGCTLFELASSHQMQVVRQQAVAVYNGFQVPTGCPPLNIMHVLCLCINLWFCNLDMQPGCISGREGRHRKGWP